MTDEPKLKPCPECVSSNVLHEQSWGGYATICCLDCDFDFVFEYLGDGMDAEDKASDLVREKWNGLEREG